MQRLGDNRKWQRWKKQVPQWLLESYEYIDFFSSINDVIEKVHTFYYINSESILQRLNFENSEVSLKNKLVFLWFIEVVIDHGYYGVLDVIYSQESIWCLILRMYDKIVIYQSI